MRGQSRKKRKICAGINDKYLWGDWLFNGPSCAGTIQKKKENFVRTAVELIYSLINRDHCIEINTLQIQDKYFDTSS